MLTSKIRAIVLGVAVCVTSASMGWGQTPLDTKTRCAGIPPMHQTVSSAAEWMQNPTDLKVEIAVTNLYADADDYLEIDVAGQRQIFYGAGMDDLGNYIPTNYPPVIVNAVLRREYPMSIMCPNSGPNGSPLFKLADFYDPDYFISTLTNSSTSYAPAVSDFLWSNFTAQAQYVFTNGDSSIDPTLIDVRRTNLVWEMNGIITNMSLYDSNIFSGVTLSDDTTNLLAQNPTGQDLFYLNRLLLRDAIYLGANSGYDGSGSAEITFSVKSPPELKIKKTTPAPGYTVLLNRDSSSGGVLNLVNSGEGNASTNYSTLEIIKDKYSHIGFGDGCDDATKAPGQGNWVSIGPGCTEDTNRISIAWNVSLGRTFDGLAAGQLALRETGLFRNTFTPSAIFYNAAYTNIYAELPLGTDDHPYIPTNLFANVILVTTNIPSLATNSGGEIYTNYDYPLRQIKSCQTFVDILTPDTNQTVLKFYLPGQVGAEQNEYGLYTNINGSPFVSWTIQNPEPSTTNKLYVIESRNGNFSTNSLVKSTSGGTVTWTLTEGSGAATRVETREVSFQGSPATNRVEIDTIKYAGAGNSAYQCQETYHFYPWGSELKETRISAGTDLVTTYEYYDDRNETYGDWGYGKIKSIIYPDGYWEKRIYERIEDVEASIFVIEEDFDWYGNGLLRYVLKPSGYGAGAATGPEDATPYNTIFTGYSYPGLVLGGTGRASYEFDGFSHDISESNIYFDETYAADDTADEGPTRLFGRSFGWDDNIYGYEQDTWTYSDSAFIGLSGHPQEDKNYDGRPNAFYYYDFGIFTNGNEFVLNPTNHLYADFSPTNSFPSHRETIVRLPSPLREATPSIEMVDEHPSSGPGYDYFSSLEEHPIYEAYWGSGVLLAPNRSTKQVRIFESGNLVQTEDYVYTGQSGGDPQWSLFSKIRYYNDSLGHATNVVRIDGNSRVVATFNYKDIAGDEGELLMSETDEFGNIKTYTYDSLKRVQSVVLKGFGGQPDKTNTITYDANGQILTNTTSAGSLSLTESWQFDLAGRQTLHIDQSGIAVTNTYSADGMTVTNIFPGGLKKITEKFPDRQIKSITGDAVVNEFHAEETRGVQNGIPGMNRNTTIHLGHENSPRWTREGVDPFNFPSFHEKPAGQSTTNTIWSSMDYSVFGWPEIRWASGGFPVESYTYDMFGNSVDTFLHGDWLEAGVHDVGRGNGSLSSFIQIGGNWYRATTNHVYLTADSTNRTQSAIHLEQLTGLASDVISSTENYDADTNETVTVTYLDRNNNKITVVTIRSNTSSLSATNVYQNGLLISSSTLSVASPTKYFYDALGRTNQIQNSLGFSSYTTYDSVHGWVTSATDFTGNMTFYDYYGVTEANAGKIKTVANAAGKNTYYSYTSRGELYRTWGDVPYPAEYHYSEYGDLTNLMTFRGGIGWSGSTWPASPGTGDNTYWTYDEASGALLEKTDAQGRKTTYTYYPETGRLRTRSWQRMIGSEHVTVTNFYDTTYLDSNGIFKDDGPGFGDLVTQAYNDGTPDVQLSAFNRVGKPETVIDATGTNSFQYDHASRLVSVTGIDGLYEGIIVSNHFNPYYGRDKLQVLGLSTNLTNTFGYDTYGRLGSVSKGNYSATYGYAPDSDFLQTTTFKSGSTNVMTTARQWDYGSRLRSIANMVDGVVITSHSYLYDGLNRRRQATLEDGSIWKYDYNDRDELISGKRYWSDWTPVAGQQFEYDFDNIGNRKTAKEGGDANGANLRTETYTANSLNQYTNRTVPNKMDIIGVAYATSSVTVNNNSTYRKGEYYQYALGVTNLSYPAWMGVTNKAVLGANTESQTNHVLVPPMNQILQYDKDGNLTNDSVWAYSWDAENRLIQMTNTANVPVETRKKLVFGYDYMSRRVTKQVYGWNSGTANWSTTAELDQKFIYDAWNLIAVLNSNSSLLNSFTWGQDLSRTMDNAGGVGGLLIARLSGTNCFVGFDGNGNITVLSRVSDKSIAARYEHNPLGKTIRMTGLLAKSNPFRFSNKYTDDETSLIYYGYRFYNPNIGRWITRDPFQEKGGRNLYSFVNNSSLSLFDTDGRAPSGLQDLVDIGQTAYLADKLFWMSGFDVNNGVLAGQAEQMAISVDAMFNGALLKNVGGAENFSALGMINDISGPVKLGIPSQSFGAAVVAGRLTAVSALGYAARDSLSGRYSNGSDTRGLANGYLHDVRGGNSAFADLDAVLLGAQIGRDLIGDNILYSISGFTAAMLRRDVAGASQYLASYNALNAWDMLDEVAPQLEDL